MVLMTAAHISPNVFSLRKFLSNIQRLFLWCIIISFIPIIHHIYTHIYIFQFYTSCSYIHFFGSSWQAGCPRLLVSDIGAQSNTWHLHDVARATTKNVPNWESAKKISLSLFYPIGFTLSGSQSILNAHKASSKRIQNK